MFRQGRSRCRLEGQGRLPGPCDMEGMGKSVSYKETTVNKDAGLGMARHEPEPQELQVSTNREETGSGGSLDSSGSNNRFGGGGTMGTITFRQRNPGGKHGRHSGKRWWGLTSAVLDGAGPGGEQGAGPLRGLGPTR